ncbi:hypothetical protein CQY20_12520 [Mycolicibacterium agri]|uniref:Uncharacterized protein n=1 Tax=Mycolicibacterium agri TaxID=36811 RepID=A0A2A7N4K4_MYCAG|nr:hypothetical protein [Mycolicibacterium agri]PEG38780.1 hypothetical protein CQY20_12520 [Mycolicibacterium agri]GFG53366.1 hypothetical protein MAGR_48070 [Mycolicibacterium agri]
MTASGDDDRIPELTEAEKIRWRAAESDLTAMSEALNNGTATPDDVDGAFARLMALDIDHHKHRNALHIPPDAGELAVEIEAILRRIPDGWGRWLSVDAGWYPLVIATDKQLARLDPHYRVHQIKEKFGTLRYYCWLSNDDASSELFDAMYAITDDAERASAIICERCGQPGILHQSRRVRVKTLCTTCADHLGYTPHAH